MYCIHCGKELIPGTKYCVYCGEKIRTVEPPTEKPYQMKVDGKRIYTPVKQAPKKKKQVPFWIILLTVLIALVIDVGLVLLFVRGWHMDSKTASGIEDFDVSYQYFAVGESEDIVFTAKASKAPKLFLEDAIVGVMHDDGINGDTLARDGIYSYQMVASSEMEMEKKYYSGFDSPLSDAIVLYFSDLPTEEEVQLFQNAQTRISEIECGIADENGLIAASDVERSLQLVADYAEQLAAEGQVSEYRINENNVFIHFTSGLTTFYIPNTEGNLSEGDDARLSILTYEPFREEFPTIQLDEFAQNVTETLDNCTLYARRDDDLVTLDAIKKDFGPNQVILWFGHGSMDVRFHSIILTGERNLNAINYYAADWVSGRITVIHGGRIAITPAFIEHYCGRMDNTLVYLNCCESGKDSVLANAFRAKGAAAIVCNTDTIRTKYARYIQLRTMDNLCSENPNTGRYYTLAEALIAAKNEYGYSDAEKDYGGKGAKTIIIGDGSFRLSNRVPNELTGQQTVDMNPEYLETTFSSGSGNIGSTTVRLKKGFDFVNTGSSVYNSDLALTAVTLSAQIYPNAEGDHTEMILDKLGYDRTTTPSIYSATIPAVCFGYKSLGEGKNLFTAIVRGTADFPDYLSDLNDGTFAMFRNSGDHIAILLEKFMSDVTGKSEERLKSEDNYFFFAGHSLGGAVANYLSIYSSVKEEYAHDDKERIYTYTFESPHTCINLLWMDVEGMSNAFNLKVDGDAVTNVPPYLGSTTYGKDVIFKVDELNDTLFNQLFPNSKGKTVNAAVSVDGHGDPWGLHDIVLDLLYILKDIDINAWDEETPSAPYESGALSSAYEAYLQTLLNARGDILRYTWQHGGGAKTEGISDCVVITDICGDKIPELIFVKAEPDEYNNVVYTTLNIMTFRDGEIKPLYSSPWDTVAGGGFYYTLYQVRGDPSLRAYICTGDEDWTNEYDVFLYGDNGILSRSEVCREYRYPVYDQGNYYHLTEYSCFGSERTEDDYLAQSASEWEKMSGILMTNNPPEGTDASDCAAMPVDEAIAWLKTQLGIRTADYSSFLGNWKCVVGYDYENTLAIDRIEGDIVTFRYSFYRLYGGDDITAVLYGNEAYFTDGSDGTSGTLLFGENSVTLHFDATPSPLNDTYHTNDYKFTRFSSAGLITVKQSVFELLVCRYGEIQSLYPSAVPQFVNNGRYYVEIPGTGLYLWFQNDNWIAHDDDYCLGVTGTLANLTDNMPSQITLSEFNCVLSTAVASPNDPDNSYEIVDSPGTAYYISSNHYAKLYFSVYAYGFGCMLEINLDSIPDVSGEVMLEDSFTGRISIIAG